MVLKENISKASFQLKLPATSELFETPVSIHWFDKSGIMYAVSKKVERTVEHYKKVIELYAMFAKDRGKLCLLADSTNTMPMSKEVRSYLMTEMPKYIKAHAVISEVPFKGTKFKTFINLNFSGIPVALFPNEAEAKKWLKDF